MSFGKNDGKEGGTECDPKDAFIHVGDRGAAGDPDAGGKTGQKQKQTEVSKIPTPREETMFGILTRNQKKKSGKKPSNPGPAKGVKFEIGHFELDFWAGKNPALLLFDNLVEGKRNMRRSPRGIERGSAGWRDHPKGITGYERREKADPEGNVLGGGGKGKGFGLGAAGT